MQMPRAYIIVAIKVAFVAAGTREPYRYARAATRKGEPANPEQLN